MTQPREGSPNLDGVARDAAWLERNRNVLGMLLQGVSVMEIAKRLGRSSSSIGKIRERLGELETEARDGEGHRVRVGGAV